MNMPLYLFCGGSAYDGEGRPKPLITIREDESLLKHFLLHLKRRRSALPHSVTLLCEDDHEKAFRAELKSLSYPVPIYVRPCGQTSTTFEKFSVALGEAADRKALVQFGYPDIFFLDSFPEPENLMEDTDALVYITAAPLTSRFPRLTVDLYNNKVKGISKYSSPIPSDPLFVFGGDLWGRVDHLDKLTEEFRLEVAMHSPSLEYDFFFWLVNHDKMRSVMHYGERLWVDSTRDISRLLAKIG